MDGSLNWCQQKGGAPAPASKPCGFRWYSCGRLSGGVEPRFRGLFVGCMAARASADPEAFPVCTSRVRPGTKLENERFCAFQGKGVPGEGAQEHGPEPPPTGAYPCHTHTPP